MSDKSILIVDDTEINRGILSEIFKDNYGILEAENGKKALGIIAQKKDQIAAILLDIVMPEMDGFRLLEELFKHNIPAKIPVLMITADNSSETERKCYEKYIKYAIPTNMHPDKSFVFITYAGMAEDDLLWIRDELNNRFKFDHIIFQKASAGIASNCGEGTFGLLYLIKGNHNYNLGALFAGRNEEDEIDLDEFDDVMEDAVEEAVEEAEESSEQEEEKQEAKWYHADGEPEAQAWYETIPGIDAAVALKNSGSEESFLSVLGIYYESYDAKAAEIQKYFEDKDWENYTIKVHALKSSSRLVGAVALGNAAEALEMAGKNKDIDFITEHHDSLMDGFRAIHEELTPMLGKQDDLPEIPADMLTDAYAGMSEFVHAKDYELARMVMDSVKEYKLPDEDEERFSRIGAALSKMDWDDITDILNEVL